MFAQREDTLHMLSRGIRVLLVVCMTIAALRCENYPIDGIYLVLIAILNETMDVSSLLND